VTKKILPLILILLAAVNVRAQEPIRLPEKLILDENASPFTRFQFPGEVPPPVDPVRLPFGLEPLPKPLSVTLEAGAASRDSFFLRLIQNNERRNFAFGYYQEGEAPFPDPARELRLEFQQLWSLGLVETGLRLAPGFAMRWPAIRRRGTGWEADSSAGGKFLDLSVNTGVRLPTAHRLELEAGGRLLDAVETADLKPWQYLWRGRFSLFGPLGPKWNGQLYLDYQAAPRHSAGTARVERFIPGLRLTWQIDPFSRLGFEFRNFTDQAYEVVPGRYGPGQTVRCYFSRSF